MHLVQTLQTLDTEQYLLNDDDDDNGNNTAGHDRTAAAAIDAAVYDVPRGVKHISFRSSSEEENDGDEGKEAEESKQVWESLLKPKTTAVGAHNYFVIATQRESIVQEKDNLKKK